MKNFAEFNFAEKCTRQTAYILLYTTSPNQEVQRQRGENVSNPGPAFEV
jgi:hypothetical protein